MRDENRRARLFKQGCESVRAHIIIELARVRRPGALELIDGLFCIGEGRALKYRRLAVFIRANAAEHEHRMVGIHRIGCIRVLAIIGFKGKSGLADARLVDEVCREAFAQENILEPLAAVRRRFPRAFRLCAAMFKNQRIFFRMHWFLIEGIGMVAISRLARRL